MASLKDDLPKLEQEMNHALTTVVADNRKDLDHLESLLTALHNKADKLLDTEIGALSNDIFVLIRHIVKVEDDLAKLHSTLNDQMATSLTLSCTKDQILCHLDVFEQAAAQSETRLTQLKAVTASSIPSYSQPLPLPFMLSPRPSSRLRLHPW